MIHLDKQINRYKVGYIVRYIARQVHTSIDRQIGRQVGAQRQVVDMYTYMYKRAYIYMYRHTHDTGLRYTEAQSYGPKPMVRLEPQSWEPLLGVAL